MPTEYILNEDQEKWLTALESGEYKQCRSMLSDGAGFCCLGVACDVLGVDREEIRGTYLSHSAETREVRRRLRLHHFDGDSNIRLSTEYSLAELNDDESSTFKEIAAVIRKNPSVYFHE